MTLKAETACTYWVCVDCYFTHHGLEDDDHAATVAEWVRAQFMAAFPWLRLPEHEHHEPEPLALIPESAVVTAGLLYEEHDTDCENRRADGWDEVECSCERMEFSWRHCDGCGSTLGGAREALTVWEQED